VHRERPAALIGAVAEPPEDLVLPGRGRRDAPGAIGAPVIGEVAGEDWVPLLEDTGAEGVGIIPAMPELAVAELRRLPAQVRLLRLADPEGAVPEELGIPFREAEFPGHDRAPELPLAVIPPAVHRPVPGERDAILNQE